MRTNPSAPNSLKLIGSGTCDIYHKITHRQNDNKLPPNIGPQLAKSLSASLLFRRRTNKTQDIIATSENITKNGNTMLLAENGFLSGPPPGANVDIANAANTINRGRDFTFPKASKKSFTIKTPEFINIYKTDQKMTI
ncbi:hypothetical protein [Pseudomonas syringae]|uniref:hypothetical protein n=1 Tax=Pseudomonas syringae TaxID=317 RepID=UPI00128EB96B|nr:hypothetical protein [Pseudomonas syringae]